MELLDKLNQLHPFDTPQKRAEADALICREWIRLNPLPSPQEMDRQLEALTD